MCDRRYLAHNKKESCEDAVRYMTVEYGTVEEGYVAAFINAVLMDDPNEDYYCYVRETDGWREAGTFLHIDLKRGVVE